MIALVATVACTAAPEVATEDEMPAPSKAVAGPAPIEHARMVSIPAGVLQMGRPAGDPGMYGAEWKQNELPQHAMPLDAFEIDRDEVTVADYARFLEAWSASMEST